MELMKRAMALKDRVREAREAMGLSQNALARKAGVNHPTLHKIEAGQRTDISSIILLKIARALNTTVEALLGEDVPLEPTPQSDVAALVETVSRLTADLGRIADNQDKGAAQMQQLQARLEALEANAKRSRKRSA